MGIYYYYSFYPDITNKKNYIDLKVSYLFWGLRDKYKKGYITKKNFFENLAIYNKNISKDMLTKKSYIEECISSLDEFSPCIIFFLPIRDIHENLITWEPITHSDVKLRKNGKVQVLNKRIISLESHFKFFREYVLINNICKCRLYEEEYEKQDEEEYESKLTGRKINKNEITNILLNNIGFENLSMSNLK